MKKMSNSLTPICDFVSEYNASGSSRLHMPGHKGIPFLGCEERDITEIYGADELYAPEGIILESENIATDLFGSEHTYYSTEGSTQCIKAMLAIAIQRFEGRRKIIAARNVHKAFIYGCAMLDIGVKWLYPKGGCDSLCSCPIDAQDVRLALEAEGGEAAAVYLTSPDYLGGRQDIAAIARVCREYGAALLVDNAHGAYLRFLPRDEHPLALGADICCDSAHKTLPVLTGGAYLHISKDYPADSAQVRAALAMFGSTSPSYLILQSLDRCNEYLSGGGYRRLLAECMERTEICRRRLRLSGWEVCPSDALKIVLRCCGAHTAKLMREWGIECEFADNSYIVLMVTPETPERDYRRLEDFCHENAPVLPSEQKLFAERGEQVMSIRDAVLSRCEFVPAENAIGRICAAPTVSCPPAVPIVVSGERITSRHAEAFRQCGISSVCVVI